MARLGGGGLSDAYRARTGLGIGRSQRDRRRTAREQGVGHLPAPQSLRSRFRFCPAATINPSMFTLCSPRNLNRRRPCSTLASATGAPAIPSASEWPSRKRVADRSPLPCRGRTGRRSGRPGGRWREADSVTPRNTNSSLKPAPIRRMRAGTQKARQLNSSMRGLRLEDEVLSEDASLERFGCAPILATDRAGAQWTFDL